MRTRIIIDRARGALAAAGIAAAALLVPASCLAFGALGHQVVAEIAERELTPAARAEVERLLGDRAKNAMRAASTWADEVRGAPEYRATARLHFVNINDAACHFQPDVDCAGGQCVVQALLRFEQQLRTGSEAERAVALRFVVHLVADEAMPFHAIGADHGGNQYQVRYGPAGTNLHAVFDTKLLEERGLAAASYADGLLRAPLRPPAASIAWSPTAPIAWAEESCRLAHAAYPPARDISREFVRAQLPVLENQLLLAGLRLANLLNAALDPHARPLLTKGSP